MSSKVPDVVFRMRARGESVDGRNPFRWFNLTTEDVFAGKNVVLFALPAAVTPRRSNAHLPDYEANYEKLKSLGIDEVYCLSINSPFAMIQWAKNLRIDHIKMLPDPQENFTKAMDMLVKKGNGKVSWRYSAHVVDGEIKKLFSEPGKMDDCSEDPFECSDVETMIAYLKEANNHQ